MQETSPFTPMVSCQSGRAGRHASWVLIEEFAEGGDVLARLSRESPEFLSGFTRQCAGAVWRCIDAQARRDSPRARLASGLVGVAGVLVQRVHEGIKQTARQQLRQRIYWLLLVRQS